MDTVAGVQISTSGNGTSPRLIALKLRDQRAFVERVRQAWSQGEAVLPLDPGAPAPLIAAHIARFAPDLLVSEAGEWPLPKPLPVRPDTAAVLLTSGTTGAPKGVELSLSALREAARLVHERLGAVVGDRWTCPLPLHHIAGFSMIVRSEALGTEIEFVDPGDGASLERAEGNLVSLVPTQLVRLMADGVDLTRFKAALLGGSAVPEGLLDGARAAGVNVVRTYGMTETAGGVVYDGVPLAGVSVRVGDSVLPGAVSSDTETVALRTPTLMTGYHGSDTTQGDWFETNDVGRITGGKLAILGRADDIINTGGEKVMPREVEEALLDQPGVSDAFVYGAPDPEWGERVVAVVAGDERSRDSLTAALKERLARHQIPKEIVFVPKIPRSASGKVDKALLKEQAPGVP